MGAPPPPPHPFASPVAEDEVPRVRPAELAGARAGGTGPVLIDLRPPAERAFGHLPGDRSLPLSELLRDPAPLARGVPVLLYDHRGEFAPRAAARLRREHGILAAVLEGGIDAYAREVDPALGRYEAADPAFLTFQLPRPETGCLAYLLVDPRERRAIVIDPGLDVDPYLARLSAGGWSLEAIIESHTHADHLAGHARLHARTGAPIYLGRRSPASYPHRSLEAGEEVRAGELSVVALETPGHTMDHLTLRSGGRIYTGDTLLLGSCGRTDLGGGDPHALYRSLHDVLLHLPEETEVLPAHFGPRHALPARYVSTLALERATNEALRLGSEAEFLTYMTEGWPPKPADFDRIVAANLADAPAPD